MVKCTNGVNTITVTEGAFETIFKSQGFRRVDNDADVQMPVENGDGVENGNEELPDELIEKPISEWSKQEVKDFAANHNIDISGTRNVSQAKEIIKRYLEELQ
jgi:hypothetical protein